jgi:DNA-directed RNA polymerase specialized sigma24 family protein
MCCKVEGRTLSDLMTAYQAGEGEAFCELYAALRPTLASNLVSLGADPDSLDALVDEVFLAIHAARRCWNPGSPVERWTAAIARHVFAQHAPPRAARRCLSLRSFEITPSRRTNRRE